MVSGAPALDDNARRNPAAVSVQQLAIQQAAGIREAAAALVVRLRGEVDAKQQAFHASLEQKITSVEAAFAASKQRVLADKTQTIAAARQATAHETAQLAAHKQAEATRLHGEATKHKAAAAAHVEQQASAASSHGDAEATRAGQEAEARAARVHDGAPEPSGDPPVVEAQSNANSRIGAQAATNFRADGGKLAGESRQAASQLASSMHQQQAQFEAKIDSSATDGAGALDHQLSDAQRGMASASHGAEQAATALCDHAITSLDEQRTQAVGSLRQVGEHTIAELARSTAATLSHVTEEAGAAAGALEQQGSRVAQSLGAASPERAQTDAAAAQAAIHHDAAAVRTRLDAGGAALGHAADGALGKASTSLGQAAQAHAQSATQSATAVHEKLATLSTSNATGIAEAGRKSTSAMTEAVTTASTKMGEGRTQFCGAIDQHAQRGQAEISKQVNDGLSQQQAHQQTVAQKRGAAAGTIHGKYGQLEDEASARSKAEQDGNASTGAQRWSIGGLWDSFTSWAKGWLRKAFGDFWGGLVWGILSAVVQLVICIVILAAIAAIFTPFVALVVGIIALVVFAGMGIYSRFQEFNANNGRSPGFWEGAALVGLGIADITGIPQIIEGAVGERAFSNGHKLTDFQRGELVGGGIVQLVASVAAVFGLVSGKPTIKPGDIKPGDIKPGELKPGELKPGEVEPGEVKPGERGTADPAALRSQKLNELADRLEVDFKNDPLRAAYESEVSGLKGKADALIKERGSDPAALEQTAREMVKARRDLGVKYKDKTPEPLRDYIYQANEARYGDPLGPSWEFLMDKYKGDFLKIIDASTRPNPDINTFMSGFRKWLLEGSNGDKYLPKDTGRPMVIPPPPTHPSREDHP